MKEVRSEWLAALGALVAERAPESEAAVLVGSHARGDATDWSDIDVVCVGEGPGYAMTLSELGPVSWTFAHFDDHVASMMNPATCAQVVPAWRGRGVDPRAHDQRAGGGLRLRPRSLPTMAAKGDY